MKFISGIVIFIVFVSSCVESRDNEEENKSYKTSPIHIGKVGVIGDDNSDITTEGFDWSGYEVIQKEKKLDLMEELRFDFEYLAVNDNWKEENIEAFHFIDIDTDNDLDCIFEGWSGGEPNCVRIYLNVDTTFVKVFDEFQKVTDLEISEKGLGSLSIEDPGCCGSYMIFNMDYRVGTSRDTMRFTLLNRTARTEDTELPNKQIEKPKRFVVENDVYYLRATPKIDTVDLWYGVDRGKDNIIAEFNRGVKGTAIGESIDETGRVWWYVEMDTDVKPAKSHFYDLEEVPTKMTGWMSSKFVREI